MIAAAVTELQFVGLGTIGKRNHLMTKADAKDGIPALQLPNQMDDRCDIFRVTRSIGNKDSIRFHRFDLFGRRIKRNDGDVAAVSIELTDYVQFDTTVDGDDIVSGIGGSGVPFTTAGHRPDLVSGKFGVL